MRLLLALMIMAPVAWEVIAALKRGHVHLPIGDFRRKRHPIIYWASLAFGTLLAITFLATGLGRFPGPQAHKGTSDAGRGPAISDRAPH